MSDQHDAGSLPELTPEQESEVRRLLAEARHDEPVPADVAARLETTLADLVAARTAEEVEVDRGSTLGTVKSRCSRGRARLATLLGVLRPGGEPDHVPPGNPDPLSSVRTTEASRAPPHAE